ncbi:MAG TPA: glutaredoxin family protein [Bryobacteraceae bacterium]|nr:glutaredoxin family protein [Bryobacteraceae bacterium]
MTTVKVYGADWCGPTRRVLSHLDDLGVPYQYINVEEDSAASEWVKQQNGGKEKKPTIDIGGTILTSPRTDELEQVLRRENLLAA